jgi:carboxyl-terminal processing protease
MSTCRVPRARITATALLLTLVLGSAARAQEGTAATDDVITEALELVVDRYWRPEEVELDQLLGAGLQRLERAGDRVLVTGPDASGVYTVEVGRARQAFATRDVDSVDAVVGRMREAMAFVEGDLEPLLVDEEMADLEVLALQGLLQPLDRHCRVIDESKLADFEARYRGTLSGIGAKVGKRNDVLTVVKVYEETPAEEGGLRRGDVITHIDGVATLNMRVADAIARIRGAEGILLTLTVRRPGEEGRRTFELVRRKVVLPTIDYRLVDGKYALLALDHFSQQTSREFKRDLARLVEQAEAEGGTEPGELTGVIIDLRGNQGGSMLHASWIVDYFVDSGEILRTQGATGGSVDGLRQRVEATEERTMAPWPVVVLVDGKTASGSEILAGGLKFLDRALVVGTQSFGKGTVQKPYELREELQMKLTVARYLVAKDIWLADVGITPDVVLGELFIDDDEVTLADELLDPEWTEPLAHADWQPTRDGANAQPELHLLYPYLSWAGDGYYDPAQRSDEDAPWQPDLAVVLAKRILGATAGVDRGSLVEAARAVVEAEGLHQQVRLQHAMLDLGVTWSASPGAWMDGSPLQAAGDLDVLRGPPTEDVEVVLDVDDLRAGETAEITLRLTNRSERPLVHLRAGLLSELRALHGLGFVIGDLEPGASATATASVEISPRMRTRMDRVRIVVLDDSGPLGGPVATHVVTRGTESPLYALRVSPTSTEPEDDGARMVEFAVEVRNDSDVDAGRVRVAFENPGREGVELQEPYHEISSLAPGETRSVVLRVAFGAAAATTRLVLEIDDLDYGVGTSVGFPVDPSAPTARDDWYRPPVIAIQGDQGPLVGEGSLQLHAEMRDDEGMDHVQVWMDGDKLQLIEPPRRGRKVVVRVEIPLLEGINTLKLVAVDATGIRAEHRYAVLGR